MKSGKQKILRSILCILAVFIMINIVWYIWRMEKYGAYSKGMNRTVFATWIVPRYGCIDEDKYDYGVKYPSYLSLTGNMSVGLPATDENPFTDFLVIWPKPFGGYEYGISFTYNDTGYQIYINEDGSAVDPRDSETVSLVQTIIQDLLERANEKWDLK